MNQHPMKTKNKGRIYARCPEHKLRMKFGDKSCLKRLYFKPNNKLKSIEGLWICEWSGVIYQSAAIKESRFGPKNNEYKLTKIGDVNNWQDKFPLLAKIK